MFRRTCRIGFLCFFVLSSLCLLSGCGSTGNATAITLAGVGGAYYTQSILGTQSEITVKVERFDRLGYIESRRHDQARRQELDRRFQQPALAINAPKDLVFHPSEDGIRAVIRDLDVDEGPIDRLKQSRDQMTYFRAFLVRLKTNFPGYHGELDKAIRDVDEIDRHARSIIDQHGELKQRFKEYRSNDASLQSVASELGALRDLAQDPPNLSSAYFSFVALSINSTTIDVLRRGINPDGKNGIGRKIGRFDAAWLDSEREVYLDETRDSAFRFAVLLRPWAEELAELRDAMKANPATTQAMMQSLPDVLSVYGVMLSPADLTSLIPGDTRNYSALAAKETIAKSQGLLATVIGVEQISKAIYQTTYAQFGIDFNTGPIRDEMMQVLLTGDAIGHVLDEANSKYWSQFSLAHSYGGIGNHDALIYLESLGQPVLKSSAFDPTKFQVANGQMFRRAFGAVADIYGLPEERLVGAGDGPTPVGSVNLQAIRDARAENKKQAAETYERLLSSGDQVVDLAETLPNRAIDDQAKRAAALKAISTALEEAASELRGSETDTVE